MAIKKLVYLEPEQERRVKELARRAKTSETEVIRRAIDAYASAHMEESSADRRRVMQYINRNPAGWADDPQDFFHG